MAGVEEPYRHAHQQDVVEQMSDKGFLGIIDVVRVAGESCGWLAVPLVHHVPQANMYSKQHHCTSNKKDKPHRWCCILVPPFDKFVSHSIPEELNKSSTNSIAFTLVCKNFSICTTKILAKLSRAITNWNDSSNWTLSMEVSVIKFQDVQHFLCHKWWEHAGGQRVVVKCGRSYPAVS